jgi:ribonuclease P/MRP protein subunit POP5
MVRLKERYLLVNILYPPDAATPHDTNVPDYVALHRPTTDKMESRDLLKGIRAQVLTLFGDYGTGVLEGNLQGMPVSLSA